MSAEYTEHVYQERHYEGYVANQEYHYDDYEPIHQREEIVRCRDCKHYVKDPDPIDPGWPMMCEDTGRDMLEPDGFCKWGEVRVGSSKVRVGEDT